MHKTKNTFKLEMLEKIYFNWGDNIFNAMKLYENNNNQKNS